jgi:class 3 adenylate cyclase
VTRDPATPRTAGAERKLVTVVLADVDEVVDDFDERDPEDVGGSLQRHLDRVRVEIERFGGVVEHTLGGRAVGVFGIPRTRDDDPERAVRAALAIREALSDRGSSEPRAGDPHRAAGGSRGGANERLTETWSTRGARARGRDGPRGSRVHVSVATGEALVALDAPPGVGRRVSGDVLATCARLQEATPAGGVLVTESTMRSTERTISYGPESIVALRSGDPVKVWSALEPRIRAGVGPGVVRHLLPLVARDRELAELHDRFMRVLASGRPEMVTIAGEPGIGKSRLAAELADLIESEAGRRRPEGHEPAPLREGTDTQARHGTAAPAPSPARWLHGRSLPYGGGAPFRALAEVVRAEAGIGDTDTPAVAGAKLKAAVDRAVPQPDAAAWVSGHLRRLLGLAPATQAAGSAEPRDHAPGNEGGTAARPPSLETPLGGSLEASFTAWRRFLYGLARNGPLLLVLEELHWADDALLDFLLELTGPASARQAGHVPLLVVGVARPELLDRRPDWNAPRDGRSTVLQLAPLADGDTIRLLERLLARHGLPGGVEPRLLDKVAGNPLFAEEYVRMVRDRELSALDAQSFGRSLPTTVRAIIAARLDALPPDEKAVLQDAAVLGQVGWVGALAALGGWGQAELEERLAGLERKEFLHRSASSRVAGEVEYAFRHVLVCDVAYAQIVRARRAAKHRLAAAWLEELPASGAEDRPELLVHHYQAAISFGSAAGEDVSDLTDRARFALRDAGDRAAALGAHGAAARRYGQALDLWPRDDAAWPDLLLRVGRARCQADATGERELLAACQALLKAGERAAAAEAVMILGELAFLHGKGDERATHLNEALKLAKDAPPSRSKTAVLRGCMMHFVIANQHAQARVIAQEVVEMATALGLRDLEADAHGAIGLAKVDAGNRLGVADLERCIEIYDELALPGMIAWWLNLAYAHAALGDLRACAVDLDAAQAAADRFGSARLARSIRLQRVAQQYWAGHWDEVVRTVDALEAELGGEQDRHYLEWECRTWRGRIRLARGEIQEALDDAATALRLANATGDPQAINPTRAFAARALLAAGEIDEAGRITAKLVAGLGGSTLSPDLGVDLAVALLASGLSAEEELGGRGVPPTPWLEAASAFADGEFRQAAELYAAIGSLPDEAYARLTAARELLAEGDVVEGETELATAVTFYRRVGADLHLREAANL